jgi:hypothetical protein
VDITALRIRWGYIGVWVLDVGYWYVTHHVARKLRASSGVMRDELEVNES